MSSVSSHAKSFEGVLVRHAQRIAPRRTTGGRVARERNRGQVVGSLTARLRRRPTLRPTLRPALATFSRFAFSLAALALSLVGALVAAPPRPGSRLVALGEDHISSQESVVATSGDAAGSDLALLDGWASSSQFRVSD
jgi:hypothetical protein